MIEVLATNTSTIRKYDSKSRKSELPLLFEPSHSRGKSHSLYRINNPYSCLYFQRQIVALDLLLLFLFLPRTFRLLVETVAIGSYLLSQITQNIKQNINDFQKSREYVCFCCLGC